MCKCCQHCMESCWWHLIEKRFCFDEDIALYQEPLEKEEKNNNMFDNMAFYDSVSVIAGRAIVTIDPLPERDNKQAVVQQPRRLKWQEQFLNDTKNDNVSMPHIMLLEKSDDSGVHSDSQEKMLDERDKSADQVTIQEPVSFEKELNNPKKDEDDKPKEKPANSSNTLTIPDVEVRRKSLRERRMSKSLYLKIDFPREVPIIRQSSVPKFFLDTPEQNQTESTLFKTPLTALQSPAVQKDGFSYDLYSVVQREKTKNQGSPREVVPIHRENSRLAQIKDKIKLRKSKSTVSSSNIPHSNYI